MTAAPAWSSRDAIHLTIVASCVGGLALAPASDIDLFWHLAVGRAISQGNSIPTTNLWSFTAPEHPFAATAWLFDWLAFKLQARFGLAGVQVACASAIAATFALVYATGRRLGSSPSWALAITLASAAAAQTRFTQRPHVATYLCLALLALLVTHVRTGGRRAWMLGAPLLIAAWSNFHAGAAFGAGVVGLCTIGAWLGHFTKVRAAPGTLTASQWTALAGASSLAVLANPNGVQQVTYALFHLSTVNEVVTLGEFGAPPLSSHGAFWALLALGLGSQGLAWRRLDVTQSLLFVAFAILAARAMYVAPMFLIVSAPLTSVRLTEVAQQLAPRAGTGVARALSWAGPPVAMVAGLWCAPEPLAHFVQRIQLGADPFLVPERAATVVRDFQISGRCFASWDLSGFAEWSLPESPVYVDPRLLAYPPDVFQRLSAAEESQPAFDALMDDYGVEWAFRSHRVLRMSGIGRFPRERWALVYWDEAAIIFVRRSVERFAQLIQDHEIRFFTPASSPLQSWKALAGEDRETWAREARETASRAPLLANAKLSVCLEATQAGDLRQAAQACEEASAAAVERQRFHPLEGGARRAEIAIAFALLGKRVPAYLERAERLAPSNPEVLTAIGAAYLVTEPSRALSFFDRSLILKPDSPPAVEGRARALRAISAAK